jgi:hypothetical protein
MLFSVGDGATLLGAVVDGVVVVVVVVVVLDGLSPPPPPQAAVSPTIAMIAAPPAPAARRRLKRRDVMFQIPYSYPPTRPRSADGQALLILTGTRSTVQINRQSCRNFSRATVFAESGQTRADFARQPQFQQHGPGIEPSSVLSSFSLPAT